MKSVMTHQFSQVPSAEIQRSSFDRSCGYKTTFDAGYLIPFFLDEALPGDTFNLTATMFARSNTLAKATMDNMYLSSFYFAIPIRLVWDNFVKMMGEQTDPGDSIDYLVPTMTSTAVTGYDELSLHDYMGLPTKIPDLEHSSLWHRAINLCFNEWFRDENLTNAAVVDKDDGPDDPADYVLRRRSKRHDYFTSCLPWPQKGDSVSLPLGTTADVIADGSGVAPTLTNSTDTVYPYNFPADGRMMGINAATTVTSALTWEDPRLMADLTTATASTINELRTAFQLQKLLERDARGGTRYTEIIKSHFGVTSPDARLQRPEFLGGSKHNLNVTPVANTAFDAQSRHTGDLSGIGTISGSSGFVKSFTEHTLLVGFVCVDADITYQQGLHRMFSRSSRNDFYFPAFAHLGEQAVLNKEIYAQGSLDTTDDDVFGYQEVFAEYRYKPSQITGLFRSNCVASLDSWHLSEEYSTKPALGNTWIQSNPPMDRIVKFPSQSHFIFDSYIKMKCARPMPVYGTPGYLDHF